MLNIDTLVTSYPDWRVSFSATLPKGEITALIGPSGAGKSTLLGMIAGFVPVESGRLSFDGEDSAAAGPSRATGHHPFSGSQPLPPPVGF